MASKDPAVLFYTSDFLAGASLMTMKERGQYITLLCLQRERGHMNMKEMEKAVGKLSEEVKSKFVQDEDGKFFNQRMEKEIRKREAHCKKQKENAVKRWNKKTDASGNNSGTSFGNAMALPLGNGNGNKEDTPSRKEMGDEVGTTPHIPPPPVANGSRAFPTLEQVEEYAKMRKSGVNAKEFFEYYAAAQWRDAEGKPVYNWQQKFISWEMRENTKKSKAGQKTDPYAQGTAEDNAAEDLARMKKYLERMRRDEQ